MPALRRLTAVSIACLALVATGCGDASKGKLDAKQAASLTKSIDRAEAEVRSGDCGTARAAAAAGAEKVSTYDDIDAGLSDNLIKGFNHLEKELAANCDKPKATATPTETAAPTETPEDTPTPTPEPTKTASPTPEPTVTSEPTPSPTPNDTGGTDPGDQGDLPSEDPSA